MSKAAQLKEENRKLRRQLEILRKENELLRQKIDALSRRVFGKKSEQLDPAQLELLLGMIGSEEKDQESSEERGEEPEKPGPRRRRGKRRIRTPEDLEVVEEILVPEEVQADPEQWKEIDREVLEQIDYEPGRFFKRLIIRPKYVSRSDRQRPPVMVPAPPRIIDRSAASPGLLAQILIGKYCDHLPYYRQESIFSQRHGVWIPRQLMSDWTRQCFERLDAIYRHMKQDVLEAGYIQVDETPVTYLDRQAPGGSAKGYLWTYLVPGRVVLYDWHASRAAQCLESFLQDRFTGKLQCDGYSAYQAFGKNHRQIEIFGCWSHMRRKFHEARDQAPKVALWILRQIQALYAWEKELKASRAGPGLRAVARSARHRMVIDRLGKAFLRIKYRYLPESMMGKALSYALNQWDLLIKVLDHGEIELSTNLVENTIRPTALGKKNYLFFGHKDAGQRSAVIYSLIETCRIQGIEPYTYLKDVMERLPLMNEESIAQLTPGNWARSRKAELKTAA